MPSFNSVTILGNLTRDPEVRYTPNGTAVASFTLAVNEKYKPKDGGETKESVHYIDCVAFGNQAENIGKYQNKGDLLLVDGKLQQRRWEDKDSGQKRSKIEVVVRMAQFMSKRNGGSVPDKVSDAFPDPEPVGEGEIPF